MTLVEAGLIFLGCSSLYIAPTMAVGATQGSLPPRRILLLSTIFALVQTGITLLGMLCALWLQGMIRLEGAQHLQPYLVLILLAVLAAYMLLKVLRPEDLKESLQAPITPLRYAAIALRWFLPVHFTGATLWLSAAMDARAALPVFLCSFATSIAGLCLGYWQGYRHLRTAYAVGAGAVIFLAVRYLARVA